jgi:uncharacterized protein (DUF1778 family)
MVAGAAARGAADKNEAVKIQLRATKMVRDKIDKAAAAKNVTRTEFMLSAATAAAEEALLDQCLFSLDAEKWEQFQTALNAPIPKAAALKALLRKKPAWER